MTKVGAYSPETARMILDVVRYLKESGFVIQRPGRGEPITPRETPIYFRNDSGVVVPPFACMQTTGTVEAGGQNYVTVDQPTSAGGVYLFNGLAEVEVGGYGMAQSSNVLRAYKSSGTITAGDRWAPTVSEWYLTEGAGQFVVVGADDIETDVFRVMVSPVARLYRFTLNESLADGTADADILEMDATDTGIDTTIRDPLGIFATLTSVGATGLCLYQDAKYYVIQANCP